MPIMKTDISVKKLITSFKEGRLIQTYADLETISQYPVVQAERFSVRSRNASC